MQSTKTIFVVLALTWMISACGFHLRGSVAVNLPKGVEPIYIKNTGNNQLQIELRKLFTAYDIKLTTNVAEANHQLVILEHKSDRRNASIGRGARATEIQLIEDVSFEILNKQGQNVTIPNKVSERRILRNNPNQVASTGSEEALIRREMLNNLASKVVRQVGAANYKTLPSTAQNQPAES